MFCGDGIRVVHPLFQTEGDGAIPISPLQLNLGWISDALAINLNELWHSRMPKFTHPPGANDWRGIGAEYANRFYAVAIWSWPIARRLNHTGRYELRRLAIAPDAPRNTASRMLRVMRGMIRKELPSVETLISYQDTEVHTGAIYRAAGWKIAAAHKTPREGWMTRSPNYAQSNADKVRWEITV